MPHAEGDPDPELLAIAVLLFVAAHALNWLMTPMQHADASELRHCAVVGQAVTSAAAIAWLVVRRGARSGCESAGAERTLPRPSTGVPGQSEDMDRGSEPSRDESQRVHRAAGVTPDPHRPTTSTTKGASGRRLDRDVTT